jgi:uncharacterized protein (DUF1330 family)
MPAIVLGQTTVTDAAGWQRYVAAVGATIQMYGGELIFRAAAVEAFTGDLPSGGIVAIRFDDIAAARRWHDSQEYQALVPLRDASARVHLALYEV